MKRKKIIYILNKELFDLQLQMWTWYLEQLAIQNQATEVAVTQVFHSIDQSIHFSVHFSMFSILDSQPLTYHNRSHGGEGKFLIIAVYFFHCENFSIKIT